MSEPQTIVIGGGLGGCLIGLLLADAGHRVTIYEKRPDPRQVPPEKGRNINLGITQSSLELLTEIGLGQSLERITVPLRGRVFHFRNGTELFQAYTPPDGGPDSLLTPRTGVRAVSRSGLNALLVQHAGNHPRIDLRFESRLIAVDSQAGTVRLIDRAGRTREHGAELVVGADGAFSTTRRKLVRSGRVSEQLVPLSHGYKELQMPEPSKGKPTLNLHALHLWPREGYLMIALPNADGSFRCSLFLSHTGTNSFGALMKPQVADAFLRQNFADIFPHLRSPVDDLLNHPVGELVTVRCWPWHDGKVVLIGDACHAVLPFTGQGVNSAFEDCRVLLRCVNAAGPNWSEVFSRFANERRGTTDAIACTGLAMAPFLLNSLCQESFARELGGVPVDDLPAIE